MGVRNVGETRRMCGQHPFLHHLPSPRHCSVPQVCQDLLTPSLGWLPSLHTGSTAQLQPSSSPAPSQLPSPISAPGQSSPHPAPLRAEAQVRKVSKALHSLNRLLAALRTCSVCCCPDLLKPGSPLTGNELLREMWDIQRTLNDTWTRCWERAQSCGGE